jgi:hypothetical protein
MYVLLGSRLYIQQHIAEGVRIWVLRKRRRGETDAGGGVRSGV